MKRRILSTAVMSALFSSSLLVTTAEAGQKSRGKLPTWQEIGQLALDSIFEDVPERLVREYQDSQEAEALAARNPNDPKISQLSAIDISDSSLSCDFVVNELLLHITQFKSIFYFLVNGWYLGQLGDYSSCRTFTNNGQYILATIEGDYTADYTFTRGSYGKYIDFSTQMGLCIPKQCNIDNVKSAIEPLLIRYAEEAHWANPTVKYQESFDYVHDESRAFDSTLKIVGFSFFALCLLIVLIASCIELSTIGDDPEFDKDVLKELNKFKTTDQYETVIMQQKVPWARYFVAISAVRNINKMNMKPYQMRKAQDSARMNSSLVKNLSVFNGIKAISCFYILMASSFLFTWYAYLADPSQMTNFKDNVSFVFIFAVYFTAPALFLTAGFLQTFSFFQQDEEKMFTAKNLLQYYVWRMFKFVPLLAMVLVFSMTVMPFLGSGPIWQLYETTMKPCETQWWTVLVQINNIYPRASFDDKCMPWAWFIPALTQLSLLLPLFVAVYQACLPNRTLLRGIFATAIILFCAGSGVLTYSYAEGAMPVSIYDVNTASGQVNYLTYLSFDFYNDVFMLSPFHLASYFAGFGLAIAYRRFLIESELNKSVTSLSQTVEISRSSRYFTLLIENARVRYTTYVIGTLLMAGACAWCYPFMSNAEAQPNWHAALFSFAAPMLWIIGFSTYLMPALVGKAALFRSVLSCGMFLIVSNLAATMSLIGPQICLWYYLSSGQKLDISYYVTQYYFDSNAVFTFLISIVVAAISDKPFYSLVHLKEDTKCAEENVKHSIAQFRGSSVFNGNSVAEGSNGYQFVEVPGFETQSLLQGTNVDRFTNVSGGNGEALKRSRRETSKQLLGESVDRQTTSSNQIRITQNQQQMVAPVQVGLPQKANKQSPNISNDRSRITALDDLNRETMQRSTRADTNMFRETSKDQ